MKKIIIFLFVFVSLLPSCKKDVAIAVIPEPIVSYIFADSMRLSTFTMNNLPYIYKEYNNKTYYRETNKVKSNYKIDGSDIVLIFEDTSVANLGSEINLKIPNKVLLNISGKYSALTTDIFYEWKQITSSSSAVFSSGYLKADTCNLEIIYDDKTKTLSGAITKLKYPFGVYVPYYQSGTVSPNFNDIAILSAEGSFRIQTIIFKNIKSL